MDQKNKIDLVLEQLTKDTKSGKLVWVSSEGICKTLWARWTGEVHTGTCACKIHLTHEPLVEFKLSYSPKLNKLCECIVEQIVMVNTFLDSYLAQNTTATEKVKS